MMDKPISFNVTSCHWQQKPPQLNPHHYDLQHDISKLS